MATALQEKIRELEEVAERERRFTSDVAHELRTPLSALVTSAEMLSSAYQEMGPDARWAAERLSYQVKRMRRLVEELLEISRLESGRESLAIIDAELPDLIRRLLKHHGWAKRVHAHIEDVEVSTDPRRLDRVIGNLVANAIEHGDGEISIRAEQVDSQLMIHVDDHGPGIDSKDEHHVFDRFYKSDPARGGGSGLGLAIARENARLLGGEITVTSTPEATTFTTCLPNPPARSDGATVPSNWQPVSASRAPSAPRSKGGDRDETVTSQ
jgi:two-component system sensor histidine kinase MtrB